MARSRSTIALSSQISRSPFSLVAFSKLKLPSESVRAIASNAAWEMRCGPWRPMPPRRGWTTKTV